MPSVKVRNNNDRAFFNVRAVYSEMICLLDSEEDKSALPMTVVDFSEKCFTCLEK